MVAVNTISRAGGGALQQGLITQQVTNWLNGFGAAWAVLFAWDVAAVRDSSRWRGRVRWLGWGACVVLLGLLLYLHAAMDSHIDLETERITDKPTFQILHIVYLWGTTFHWALATGLAWLTLRAWFAEENRTGGAGPG